MKVLDLLRINPIIRTIRFLPSGIKEKKVCKIKEAEKKRRIYGELDSDYLKLLSLKGKYKGRRCFIVATGPSLTISDLELIKNEYSFSMNSIIRLFDQTSWRPTFYGIQDRYVFEKMKSIIESNYSTTETPVFIPQTLKGKLRDNVNAILFPYNYEYHNFQMNYRHYFSKFCDNAYGMVYDGYSITYSLIQIAIYLGFNQIFLLGCDCSYKKNEKNHIVESGHYDKYEFLNYKKMITGYMAAQDYCLKNEIKIINCTRGGMLEVFERRNLEDVLGK